MFGTKGMSRGLVHYHCYFMSTGIAIGHLSTIPSQLKVPVRSSVVREGRLERTGDGEMVEWRGKEKSEAQLNWA